VTTPKHRSPPLTRLIAVMAIVVTMPFSGIASAVQPQACDSQDVASAVTLQSADCCGAHHQPCGTRARTARGRPSGCAQGCGQMQAIDRTCMPFSSMEPSHLSAIAPVTTLISATGPDGQWRTSARAVKNHVYRPRPRVI